MRKKLLTLGALALAMSMDAQFLSYVGDKGQVFVKEGALVFNGGGIRTVGEGVVDNSGNIMVVGGSSDKLATLTTGGADKTDGGNIIMRMTNDVIGNLRYGQLYINGLTQANITGIVDKEFKDVKHGDYQQIAIPFFEKNMGDFAKEAGITTSLGARWSKKEALVWDNQNVVFDDVKQGDVTKANTSYYAMGTNAGSAYANSVVTVKGVPYADGITETLSGAGTNVNFGAEGKGINKYKERYNTYLQDAFAENAWVEDYGKNLYQFGNPFLTNLDLTRFGSYNQDKIHGIRFGGVNVKASGEGSLDFGQVTEETGEYRFVVFGEGGEVLVGDVEDVIVKPLDTFVVKTIDDTEINFDDLRRFAYTQQTENVSVTEGLATASVNNANKLRTSSLKTASAKRLATASVKQLGVIALDANGNELGRTYYYVSPNAITGAEKSDKKRQITASGTSVIGTFEENKNGGYDEEAANRYWLYINEANENDFKGKEILLALYNDAIKSLKFEIRENANLITDNATLSNGESFYIKAENGEAKEIRQGMVIASTANSYGLFYGAPEVKAEKVEAPAVAKRTETDVVFDANVGEYKVLFADDWNTATIQIINSRGRIVSTVKNVSAKSDYTIALPKEIGTYVVRVSSDAGVRINKKVLKN